MTEYREELSRLDLTLGGLESHISAASEAAVSFQSELNGMRSMFALTEKETRSLSRSMSNGLRGAFSDLIFRGSSLSDVLDNVAQSMIRSTFNQAISPVTDAISGVFTGGFQSLFGGLFAKGAAFQQGRVTPFAKGGIVKGATGFAMRGGGLGVMGEAGPEAIMPLTRGADGALGVRAQGGGAPVVVNMTVHARDADSFKRSQTQIAAGLNRAMTRGRRNT